MSAEPSPRPWRVNDLTTNEPSLFEGNQHYHVIEAGDGFYDHDTDTGFRLSGFMSDADAALIVRCVNRAEAVENLVEVARRISNGSWEAPAFDDLCALRAALAKLTEGDALGATGEAD